MLGCHLPLDIAKRYGTLDKVSNGRLILGVGVGTLKKEIDFFGAPFDRRGATSDEALRTLRASLSRPEPVFHREFYDFDGFVVDPCAVQQRFRLGRRSDTTLPPKGRELLWPRRRGSRCHRLAHCRAGAWVNLGIRRLAPP